VRPVSKSVPWKSTAAFYDRIEQMFDTSPRRKSGDARHRAAYFRPMQVTFTKVDDKRYAVAIDREHGPALVPRFAPGHDDLMPHDLAHYLVEEHFEIELGVWGQLAAGGGGIFTPAPEDNNLRYQRRAQRLGAVGRADMARSERLVVTTVTAWERSIGRIRQHTLPPPLEVDPDDLRGAVARMGEVAERWSALGRGRSLTFAWPGHLTIDPAKTQRGRRPTRRTPATSRR
jgi:hypothetical protein